MYHNQVGFIPQVQNCLHLKFNQCSTLCVRIKEIQDNLNRKKFNNIQLFYDKNTQQNMVAISSN